MSEIEMIFRLVLGAGIGALIGLERELRGRAAGVRTHALVAMGAVLFTIAGAYGFSDIARSTNVDPARVAAQVATGIGFIGAGAIIKLGASIRGLTTAATLWLTAAVGVAVGAGLWAAAVASAGVVYVILLGGRWVVPAFLGRIDTRHRVLELEYERGHGTLGPVLRELERLDGRLGRVRLDDRDDDDSSLRHATIEIVTSDDSSLDDIVERLQATREVVRVQWRRGQIG